MKEHAAIILRDGKRILFVQRAATKKSLPNIWAFPSGTIEEGETPEMTAMREAREELRIEIAVEKCLGTLALPELNAKLIFLACVQMSDQPPVCDPAEIQRMKWLTFDEFFREFDDSQIGHGLVYLRKHPEMWRKYMT